MIAKSLPKPTPAMMSRQRDTMFCIELVICATMRLYKVVYNTLCGSVLSIKNEYLYHVIRNLSGKYNFQANDTHTHLHTHTHTPTIKRVNIHSFDRKKRITHIAERDCMQTNNLYRKGENKENRESGYLGNHLRRRRRQQQQG